MLTRRNAALLVGASVGVALVLAQWTLTGPPRERPAAAGEVDLALAMGAPASVAAAVPVEVPEEAPERGDGDSPVGDVPPPTPSRGEGASEGEAPAGPISADVARHIARAIRGASATVERNTKTTIGLPGDTIVVRDEKPPPEEDKPPPPGTGLLGEYWKLLDQELLDFPSVAGLAPAIRRVDPTVDFPNHASFQFPFLARNFAARWRGHVYAPEDGSYVFIYTTDDGGWLTIDGAEVIAMPGLHPPLERQVEVFLFKGFHSIEARMFQNEGDVAAVLAWRPPGGMADIVPTEVLYPPDALPSKDAPRITAVTPLGARHGETVEIAGSGFPDAGAPALASFDGVNMNAESLGGGRLRATIPAGVDRGDIVVGDAAAPSVGFPYEAGDLFGLLCEYTQSAAEIHTLDEMPAAGSPQAFRRVDEKIEFRSAQAFALPFPARRFAARYTGQLYVREGGAHTLRLWSDDGSRLAIDRQTLIVNDNLHGMTNVDAPIVLAAGFHDIAIDFFQNEGGVGLVLEWQTPGASAFATVPRRALYAPAGLLARERPALERVVPEEAQPGEQVEIVGRGFAGDPGQDRVVFFDGAVAALDGATPTRLVVRVPARAQTGPLVVQSGELAADPPLQFRVLGRGLHAAYYQLDGPLSQLPDLGARAPTLERTDPRIAFGEDLSFNLPFEPDHFAARYTGAIEAPVDGSYTFGIGSDDGSRLFIDEKLLIDNDGLHGYLAKDGAVDLTAGRHAIRIDFFENEGVAILRLGWVQPGHGWEAVPQTALFPDR